MEWFLKLPLQIQTSLIAALVAISVGFLKDLIFWYWKESYEIKKTEINIFRAYAKPLAVASESLFWRLVEVLYTEGRGDFLYNKSNRTDFEEYKFKSTIYRLAALLGWLRAFRNELSYSVIFGVKKTTKFESSISDFKSALADGPHVEFKVLEKVAKIWNIDLPSDTKSLESIAISGTNLLKPKFKDHGVNSIKELPETEQQNLCKSLSVVICDKLNINKISDSVLDETKYRIIECLSIREAWIYRDWQDGIGDLMIRESKFGNRNFEVIGYYDFEENFLGNDSKYERWVKRLESLFDELDISGKNKLDFRKSQLEKLLLSTASLLLTLSEVESNHTYISNKTKKKATEFIQKQN